MPGGPPSEITAEIIHSIQLLFGPQEYVPVGHIRLGVQVSVQPLLLEEEAPPPLEEAPPPLEAPPLLPPP